MELELKFDKNKFIDMIKKMAVPQNNSNKRFLYPIIYPKFIPVYNKDKKYINSMLEWIAQSPDVTTWVRVEYERYPQLTDPIRIPIDVQNILTVLKNFTDKDEIFFIHDSELGIQTITDNITCIDMPIIGVEPGINVHDGYPGNLEQETEIIVFKNNMIKPDILGSCDVKFLHKLFITVKNACPKNDENRVYNFAVDGDRHLIEAYTNKENIKIGNVVSKKYTENSIEGHGKLHYTEFLENVVDVLSPDLFKFYTINCGPLWIMQDTENMKVRYLIPPAAEGTY
jgi:hypothetical protein